MKLCVSALGLLLGADLLVAGTPLIKSTDGGRTWTDIDPGLQHLGIVDLQVAGSRLYALTVTRVESSPFDQRRDFNVVSSSDGGQTWRVLDALGVTRGFAALAVAPSDPETVFVTRGLPGDPQVLTLLKSRDAGRTAAELQGIEEGLGPFSKYPYWCSLAPDFFTVHPAISTTLFMNLDCVGDYIDPFHAFLWSLDGGRAWRMSEAGATQVLVDPREPSRLYIRYQDSAGRFHLAKSVNGGEEWSPALLSDVASVALGPGDPTVLLASKNDGSLWRSTDRAETWQHLGNWLPFDRLVFHPAKPSLALAHAPALLHQGLSTGEILKSLDGGTNWTVFPTGLDGFSFVFDPSDPDTIYGISQKRLEPRLRPPYVRNLAGGSTLGPGALFSIYGDDLAGGVTFNGQSAEILFTSRRQINGRIPADLRPGKVMVEMPGQPPQSITLSPVATPVILHDSSGAPHVYHLDSSRQITNADPAQPGEQIVIYCTGLGEPDTRYLQFWPTDRRSDAQRALFADPVADQPGVYRVGVEVPATLEPGSYLLLFWGGRNFTRLEVR